MRKLSWIQSAFVLCCTGSVVALQFFQYKPFARAEDYCRDTTAFYGKRAPADSRLMFLAIDNDSVSIDGQIDVEKYFDLSSAQPQDIEALKLIAKGWPWSRAVYGLLLDKLFQAGAKAVVFDLTFPKASADDADFQQSLDRYRDRVVIGCNFVPVTLRDDEASSPTLSTPTETLIANTSPMDHRVGFVNFWPDEDDVVRAVRYGITLEQVNGGFTPWPDSERFSSLAQRAVLASGNSARNDDLNPHDLRWAGPEKTFSPHSFFEVFVPDYWTHNFGNGNAVRGKTIVVGGYGNWQHDEHKTPFGTMPGPELQLNAINALLQNQYVSELPPVVSLGLVVFAGLLSLALWLLVRTPWIRLCSVALITTAWIAAALLSFNYADTYLITFAPLFLLGATGILALVYDVTIATREKRRTRATLERYVSSNVVRELLDGSEDYTKLLGGVLKPVTILFSDIRDFSKVSSSSDTHELVTQLNEYFSEMVECVFAYHGTLDKFVGDAVMAVWGNATSAGPAADARNALRAARAMQVRLETLNQKWAARGRPTLKIGIGLNHGTVIAGNIGSRRRMEFTVIGDAVNVCWRIQEMTKLKGHSLLFNSSIAHFVQQEFDVVEIGSGTLSHTSEKMRLFTVVDRPETSPARKELSAEPIVAGS